jgi:alanyl-tRNA synthetase
MDKRAKAIRQGFLDYFARHGHTIVKSSSLVPANDPTLMFVNAGMVQFKDVFVGAEKRPYSRATSCQKCLRVSGKHNDLEEVGRTARHHTFFEMLGNFSFGDYFKNEAIELAWNLITKEWGLSKDRLWVTVFGGEKGIAADTEARAIWKKVTGLPDERILDKGMKDNFWAMGDTGPCGPCTEIHYDTRPGTAVKPDEDFDNGRVVEIWNNVFMQFQRFADGSMVPLAKTGVDTGMGLERVTAFVQGEVSNYHSDLFMPLLEAVAQASGKPYRRSDSEDDVSMRVIADHARTTAFLTAEGVQPSNEGRGYVMRRIMRRAIRHGKRLGFEDLFFARVCDVVVESMREAYPELAESRALIGKVADLEERSFRKTLDTGLRILEHEIAAARQNGLKQIPGAAVFKLYDTYGFPKDLTEVVAGERGLGIDDQGFEVEMAAQKEKSKGADVGEAAIDAVYKQVGQKLGAVKFIGYPHEDAPLGEREGKWRLRSEGGVDYLEAACSVKALIKDGQEVTSFAAPTKASELAGAVVEVVLDPTPFYGESGGQVGDKGVIVSDGGLKAEVTTSQKPVEGVTVSKARVLAGAVKVGDTVWAGYIPGVRKATRAHHSATHLLHGALRKVLGEHVKQAGSLVDPDHLRFDYAHFEAPTAAQLAAVEDDANARVAKNHPVQTDVLPFDQAKKKGALAFFGDKYGDIVRVITMGESVEFCGGTHAKQTGDIGLVLITREEAVASGVRRMEAEVGDSARATTKRTAERLSIAADILAARREPPAGETSAVYAALAKTVRQGKELEAAVKAAGGTPAPAPKAEPKAPRLAEPVTLADARIARDLWQALVLLTNARPTEAEEIAQRFAPHDTGIVAAYAARLVQNRENEKRVEQAKRSALTESTGGLLEKARTVGGIKLLAARVDGLDQKGLRELADQLRDKLGSGLLCVGTVIDGKVTLMVAVTSDLVGRFNAGKLVGELAPLVGGRGGGKPDLAQAGGSKPEGLEQAFAALEKLVAK